MLRQAIQSDFGPVPEPERHLRLVQALEAKRIGILESDGGADPSWDGYIFAVTGEEGQKYVGEQYLVEFRYKHNDVMEACVTAGKRLLTRLPTDASPFKGYKRKDLDPDKSRRRVPKPLRPLFIEKIKKAYPEAAANNTLRFT